MFRDITDYSKIYIFRCRPTETLYLHIYWFLFFSCKSLFLFTLSVRHRVCKCLMVKKCEVLEGQRRYVKFHSDVCGCQAQTSHCVQSTQVLI